MTSAAATGPRPRWKLGANVSNEPANASRDVTMLAAIGGMCARTSQELGWGSVSQRLGPYATACHDHGIELMECAQTRGHVVPKTQAGMDEYASFVAECTTVAPKPTRVRVSTGNEVNGFGSNETPNPKGQAEILLACSEAVAKYAPGGLLLTPSLCPASGKLGASYVEPLLFFEAMVAAEPSILTIPHLEVDWHGYCDWHYPADASPYTWNTAYRTIALDSDLSKMGQPKTRITWSEFGACTAGNRGISFALQATRFDQYLALLASKQAASINVGELVWYQLRDTHPANADDWPASCGLFDVNGGKKPIVDHFTAASKLLAA